MTKKYTFTEETKKRCKFLKADPETLRIFTPISVELLPYLKNVQSIDFNIYLKVYEDLVEFIKVREFSAELLEEVLNVIKSSPVELKVYLTKKDYPKFEQIINYVRNKKIKKLLEEDQTLDPKVLDVFSDLSNASQMILRGGINKFVAEKALLSASNLLSAQLDSRIALGTLSRMIHHDATLYDHSASVAMFATSLGQFLKSPLDQKALKQVALCGLYHDAGKSCIPSQILNKPGKFTPEEFEVMKMHVKHGYTELNDAIKAGAPIEEIVANVAYEHHERFTGGGYPRGKKGRFEDNPQQGIHLFTRIVSIVDVYSALLMKRVYKEALPSEEALKMMLAVAPKEYDPEIFDVFYKNVTVTNELFDKREQAIKKATIRMIGKEESFSQSLKELIKK